MSDDQKPWFAPGYVESLQGSVCMPRPREPLWTFVTGGNRIDAELLYQTERGVEEHSLYEGVMALVHRWPLRAQALQEAEEQRARLMGEGWTALQTDGQTD